MGIRPHRSRRRRPLLSNGRRAAQSRPELVHWSRHARGWRRCSRRSAHSPRPARPSGPSCPRRRRRSTAQPPIRPRGTCRRGPRVGTRRAARARTRGRGRTGRLLWAHRGATSQDVVDTAACSSARRSRGDPRRGASRRGSLRYARTRAPLDADGCARSSQQAVPTTFGLKAAGWVVAVVGARARSSASVTSASRHSSAARLAPSPCSGTTGLPCSEGHRGRAPVRPPGSCIARRPQPRRRARLSAWAGAGVAAKIALDAHARADRGRRGGRGRRGRLVDDAAQAKSCGRDTRPGKC